MTALVCFLYLRFITSYVPSYDGGCLATVMFSLASAYVPGAGVEPAIF